MVLGAGAGAASAIWLPGPAAAAIGSSLAAAIFGTTSARIKELLDKRAEHKVALPSQLVGTNSAGRLRRVRDFNDPLVLRVHPASVIRKTADGTSGIDRVPPYVPRDIQATLREAVARGGFVLLTGDSTAGKTRAAYEAIRATLPDHVLIAPAGREALSAVVPVVMEQRRVVVWLDDLERFLGSGGLTTAILARFLDDRARQTLVIATLRSAEFDRFSAREEREQTGIERESWREARDVLELATTVELGRRWSIEELDRAREFTDDPRIALALDKTSTFGLAELLAAGPQLAQDWRNAWRQGAHPRGAALVAAAVDCRRAGIHTPLHIDLIASLSEHYLAEQGGPLLRPEPLDEAVEWATTPSHGTSSLLLPADDADRYLAFDYLIDLPGLGVVPRTTWDRLIADASPRRAVDIGDAAMTRFQHEVAAVAYRKAADHNIPDADVSMAFAAAMNKAEFAVDALTNTLERREEELGSRHPATLRLRLTVGECLSNGHDPIRAAEILAALIPDLDDVWGADHQNTLRARRLYAYSVCYSGDHTRALDLLQRTLGDHERVLGHDHHDTLLTRHYICTAVAEQDVEDALRLLEPLRHDYARVLGVDSPRVLQVRTLIAKFNGCAGRHAEAADLFRHLVEDRRRILGASHPHLFLTRACLVQWTAMAGDHAQARSLFRALLDDWYDHLGREQGVERIARQLLTDIGGGGFHPARTRRGQENVDVFVWTCLNVLGADDPVTREVLRLQAPGRGGDGSVAAGGAGGDGLA
ncbi:tetratricopeptide repeat protein [Actinophytocola sp.]|uniref:tetratricopeptide repeat protein n=1 Tax=Actinophytocola sp. TaxID=1872138 RepID=UPI003D6ABEFB